MSTFKKERKINMEENKRKLIFIALIAIITIVGAVAILHKSNEQAQSLLENYEPVDSVSQEQTSVVFDSIYRHHIGDYVVDVFKSYKNNYAKLIFHYTKEPDAFVVNVSPMNDLDKYESDVIQRYIDIHEHEKMTNYEYSYKPNGVITRREMAPLTKKFNITIVHRAIQEDGKMVIKAYIRRNKFTTPMSEVLIKLEN